MSPALVRALGIVKQAAARVNCEQGLLEPRLAQAIEQAAQEVIDGTLADHFHRPRQRARRAGHPPSQA
jgi:fumarate hydratase class II